MVLSINNIMIAINIIICAVLMYVDAARVQEVFPTIVGGSPVQAGKYQSFVWMGNCGGTLIWPDMVLTSASCFIGIGTQAQIGGIYSNGTGSEIINVTRLIPHPLFLKLRPDHIYDVMLVRLANASKNPTQRLSFSRNSPKRGDNVTVIGFGYTKPQTSFSPFLSEVNLNVISRAKCQLSYEAFLYQQYVCAGGTNEGVCPGDGGGPLLIGSGSSSLQVGILSFGSKFCDKPSVYTRISHVALFISRFICKYSAYVPETCKAPPP